MGGNGGRADVDWLCAGNSLNSLHSGCAADFLESATCRGDTRRCFQPIRRCGCCIDGSSFVVVSFGASQFCFESNRTGGYANIVRSFF